MKNDFFIKKILLEYEKKRDRAQRELEYRKSQVYEIIPRIKEIDEEISKTGIKISKAILQNTDNYLEKVNEIKEYTKKLKQEKAILLTENNIPLNFLEIQYECSKCKDSGFLDSGEKCNCFKQKLIDKAYEMSNISHLLKEENFKNFNIDLFSDEKFEDENLSPKQNMLKILNICEGFVFNFDKKNDENLLFYGSTGLGKTYLCNCIAKSLLDKGKIVIYQTAFKILEILEEYKFNSNQSPEIKLSYELLFDCDLLIIDDLGTELANKFTNIEIFNIINSRLIQNKKTIISTNLSPADIIKIYGERTASRIFGKFTILKFYGPDLRWEIKAK
ncbi:DNA replication protein DnaC [Caminicella sporogenes DSM 14501]|uniref:DNA replication protein DnaC n=1 Tax=Caminicella sporogenes DSM 14501 TaxID=1121266 RepID=A0A1M6NGC2_9FIRM|nr:ATP-binding protein [Caminicella sporogenes]RKD22210.1 DNA replication protein DnaC [Caminicella sporogenes]SHJ94811.1 DNA replication protein DnaC [Caminicella sporogenes DSM 14501]